MYIYSLFEIILSQLIKCITMENHSQNESTIDKQSQTTINHIHQKPTWSPGTARLLSFLIPGVGQIYKGKVMSGIIWLILTTLGYIFLIFPGIVLHILCIINAGKGDPYKR
jgi:TM2 domain-containing membrane protein YozV